MKLTSQFSLLFLGGLLAISAVAVLLDLAIQRLEQWLRLRRERALTGPPSGTADPGPGAANERALRISHARWRMLL